MITPTQQRQPARQSARQSAPPPSETDHGAASQARRQGAIKAGLRQHNPNDISMFVSASPINNLRPSQKNPRRLTIDSAQVTDAVVEMLQPKSDEDNEQWLERINLFASKRKTEKEFWRGLVTLAGSIKSSGLVQPIVTDSVGTIIAGERRWLASRIAGLDTCPTLICPATNPTAREVLAFVENEHRQNLKPVEVVFGARQIADTLLGGCGQANQDMLTASHFMAVTGSGRSTCAYYAAFARLDNDDPLLDAFLADPPSSLKAAYAAASARNRELEQGTAKLMTELGVTENIPTPPKTASVTVPVHSGMRNLLSWLGKQAPVNPVTSQVLEALVGDWDNVDTKERRARLAEAFRHIADAMADETSED